MLRVDRRALLATLLTVLVALRAVQGTAECTLQLDAGEVEFDKCLPIEDVGSHYRIYWTQLPTSPGGRNVVRWGLSTSTGGYIAFGFPPRKGAMVGATSLTLQTCSGCNNGAELKEWFLGGEASGQITPSANLLVFNVSAARAGRSGMAATFVQELTLGIKPGAVDLIFAAGAVYANGALRKHSTCAETTLDLNTGAAQVNPSYTFAMTAMVGAHIFLMVIGWGLFIPLGVVVARHMKSFTPMWLHVHRVLQTTGVLMGLAGLVLGFMIAGGWEGRFPVHRNLGMSAVILGFLQVVALVKRPDANSRYRRAWNFFHWWQGRAAVVLGVANIYYGMINIQGLGTWAWAVYTAVFATIVASAIAKDGYDYVRLPPPGLAAKTQQSGHDIKF